MKLLLIYIDFKLDLNPLTQVVEIQKGGWYMEGVAILPSVLKNNNFDCSLYHITEPEDKNVFVNRIKEENPDIIGFTIMTSAFTVVEEYSKWAKEILNVPIIAGSYHATVMPEQTIAVPSIDIICLGEGEKPLLELMKRLKDKKPYNDIKSLWVKENGVIYKNEIDSFIENIDELPLPAFELFDYDKLISSKIHTGIVMLSRGCPYSCTYCCNSKINSLYPNKKRYCRFHSPEYSIRYLKKLLETFPKIKYINFKDDILPWENGWIQEFSKLYKKEINLPFNCNYRANLITPEIIKTLKDMGCYQIFFGVESGNDYIRNTILKRNMNTDVIIKAFKDCKEYGIQTVSYNMVGIPFEDKSKVLDTIKLNSIIDADIALSPIYSPYPGTLLHELSVKEGFIPDTHNYVNESCKYVHQASLPKKELFFVHYYFKVFIKLYKLFNCLPKFLNNFFTRIFDKLFLSKFLPHKLLVFLAEFKNKIELNFKSNLLKRFPNVYLKIRNNLRGIKTQSN